VRRIVPACVIVAIGIAGSVRGADSAASGAGVGASAETARWASVIEQLGSADFAQRQAGQKALEKATWRDRNRLAAIAATAKDEEVKARVIERVEGLDEEAALNPPPISVDMEHLRFPQMVDALGKATGRTLVQTTGGGGFYTLHAKEMPFWDVMLALDKQSELAVGDRSELSPAMIGGGLSSGRRVGEALVGEADIRQAASGGPQAWLVCHVMLDPRICVLQKGGAVYSSIVDDAGQSWTPPAGSADGFQRVEPGEWSFWLASVLAPRAGARKISAAKGVGRFIVQVARDEKVVADLGKQGTTPIDIGRFSVSFYGALGDSPRLDIHINAEPKKAIDEHMVHQAMMQVEDPLETARVMVYDRLGQMVWSAVIGTTGLHGDGRYTDAVSGGGPYRAVFWMPTKVQEIDVPLELKDMPVP
jgi:hypothetical protein